MSLTQPNNYSGASYLGNVKENWLFQLFNQDSYLSFDGVDDFIDCGSPSSTIKALTDITISLWVKFPSSSTGSNVYIFNSEGVEDYFHGFSIHKDTAERMSILVSDGNNNTNYKRARGGSVSKDVWVHVVIKSNIASGFDADNTTIIINNSSVSVDDYDSGANITSVGYSDNGITNFAKNFIADPDDFFNFDIKSFAIWGTQLDSDNITAIYNSGNFTSVEEDSGNYNQSLNLKAYWEFNNGENFAQDLTGNTSTGTITGAKYGGFLPLAYRDTKVDDVFYHGVVKSAASIRNNIDLAKSKSKTSNMSLNLINSKYQGSDLSKELFLGSNNYYNRTVRVFSQLNSINILNDCLQLYHGRMTNIKHNDNSIKLSIVSKSPWDNKVVPNVKSPNGRLFPISYGNYVKNTSSFGSEAYAEGFKKQVFPVEVDEWGFSYKCLFHKNIGSTDTTLHYYEESIDAFLPLADANNGESYGDGYIVKTKWDLKRHFKFKAIDVPLRSTGWDNTNQVFNAFDGITDETSSSTPSTFAAVDFTQSGNAPQQRNIDAQYDIPAFDDQFDSFSSSEKNGLELQIRWQLNNFYTSISHSGGLHATNTFKIIDQSRYGGSAVPTNTITDGATIFTQTELNATGTSSAVTIAERTDTYALLPHLELYADTSGQYEDGMWLRFQRRTTNPGDAHGGDNVTLKGDLKVYDVRFKTTLRVRNFNSTAEGMSRIRDVKQLYSGANGLTASWDGDDIDEGHDAHRDLLIRYAGMPTIEPENWSELDSDRTTWFIKYWLNKEMPLIKLLEKLQYEFGFVHMINPSNGKSKYIWVHGTGTNNAFRAEDVVTTLKKADINNTNISTTSVKDIITKSTINTFKHPARGVYLSSVTATNATPRQKYNIKSKENTATINLDALFPVPPSTIATDKQDDFYSYYSQINADVKKLIECEVVNIQKAYTLEVGDVIKFDDMVVEPFGSDWNNYYMIVSIVRSLGTIKITAREVA